MATKRPTAEQKGDEHATNQDLTPISPLPGNTSDLLNVPGVASAD